jgi:tetratricopeptide (TPR) repeat protein
MILHSWRGEKTISTRRLRFILFCVLPSILTTTAAALPAKTELPRAKEKWICQEEDLFTLYSAAPAKQASEISLGLELYHAVLTAHSGGKTVASPVPTFIFVFKDNAGLAPYQSFPVEQPSTSNGYFLQREDAQYIAVSAREEVTRTIYHEYAHAIFATTWPGAPLWLQEGLAEYYSTFRSDGKTIFIGEPLKEHTRTLRTTPWIPYAELMRMDTDAPAYREADKKPLFYAQAWLVTHFLFHGQRDAGPEAIDRYITLLGSGEPNEKCFQQVFHLSLTTLDQAVKAYSENASLAVTRRAPRELPVDAARPFRAVPYEEILYRLGDLLAHHGQSRLTAADDHFLQAGKVNPRYALASAGLGYSAMARDEEDAALDYFRQALAKDSTAAWIHYQYGRALLAAGRKQEAPQKQATIALARDELLRTIRLDDRFIEAQAQLGEAYMHLGMQPEGQTALEKALEGMPSRMDVARNLIQYYVLADNATKQNELLALIGHRGGPKALEAARESILRTQIDRVARLINEKEYSKALTLAEKLRKQTDDPEIKKLIDEARQAASKGQIVDIYNLGVRSAAEKRYDQAEKHFLRVIKEGGKGELADLARSNISKIRIARQAAWYNEAFALMRANNFQKAVPLLKKVINDNSDPQTTRAAENALSQIEAL